MHDIIRDSPLGQFVRLISRKRLLKYQDEEADFELPRPTPKPPSQAPTETKDYDTTDTNASVGSQLEDGIATKDKRIYPTTHPAIAKDEIVLVDWYTSDDPENPVNWSLRKGIYIVFVMCFYTVSVYIGSSIYTPEEEQIMRNFNVGNTAATLGMSLYILGYGVGTLLWSPLAEIPAVGKNPTYVYTYVVFLVLTIPSALTNSFAGLLVTRFALGFFGSPCLATAGSTYQDMFPLIKVVYPLVIWAISVHMGPSLGPVASGFSIPVKGWRWSGWEMLWLAAPTFILLFITMPETSGATILLHRAKRLRKKLGKDNLKSQSEIDQAHMSFRQITFDALIKPWEINALDPAVLFTTVYMALCYGIFYSFFECLPLVFIDMYHFNIGEAGLPFLSTFPVLAICAPGYVLWWYLCVEKPFPTKGFGPQEERLLPGLVGSVIIPCGLFLYAWTANPNVHWIWPTIGLGLNIGGTFLIVQAILLYLPFTYPAYSASLFAANNLARSSMAAAATLFARPLFIKLGVGGGVSLLGGLMLLCSGLLLLLYLYGAKLRARSRFALRN